MLHGAGFTLKHFVPRHGRKTKSQGTPDRSTGAGPAPCSTKRGVVALEPMVIRTPALLLLAAAAAALGGDDDLGGTKQPDVAKARLDLAREVNEIILDQKVRIREIKDKHLKLAQKSQAAATKKGDLKLALAWEAFVKELEPRNLAPRAKVQVGAEIPENRATNLTDGVVDTPIASQKYWFGGPRTQKPDWIRFELAEPSVVSQVRMCVPVGTQWYKNGHEPLDYDVLAKIGSKIRNSISVRKGEHPGAKRSEDGQTQWITLEFKERARATEVEFHCSRTSGANLAPAVFELEILGE